MTYNDHYNLDSLSVNLTKPSILCDFSTARSQTIARNWRDPNSDPGSSVLISPGNVH